MTEEAINYYAEKFFPHLRHDYAVLCVREILRTHGM